MESDKPIVTIIGVGLIGGSLALSLKSKGFAQEIIGVDSNMEHAEQALHLNIVDRILPLDEAVLQSDMVILSIPVNVASAVLNHILSIVKPNTIVTDMGSTKHNICQSCQNHKNRNQFVASHPIAGTEYSGPSAALNNLFENKKTIICDSELSSTQAIKQVEDMYRALDMQIIYMESDRHDKHIAYVSHLSHISSFALSLTVLDIEKDEKSILNMAGSGFSSTVRLAKSNPKTWTPILIENKKSISFALDSYIKELQNFKDIIDNDNYASLEDSIFKANAIKKILE